MNEEFFSKLRDKIKPHYEGGNNCHEFMHTERVYNLATKIAQKEKADLEIVKIATLLHDIARKKQDESKGKICHAEEGGKMAQEILNELDYPKDKIEEIKHCIESHRFRKSSITPKTTEAKVLYDADNLDAIGAIGIGRAFSFAGHVGACVHHPDKELLINSEPYGEHDCAYREYLVKLSKIKEKMLTQTGKEMAEERHDFMNEFFTRLNLETEGKI